MPSTKLLQEIMWAGYNAAKADAPRIPIKDKEYCSAIESIYASEGRDKLFAAWMRGYSMYCQDAAMNSLKRFLMIQSKEKLNVHG